MEDVRVGEWVRSERRRLGLRQADLAVRAGVGRSTVARAEAGSFPELTVRAARSVAAAVEIDLPFAPRSRRGASIEREIDWRHAALVETVLGRLDRLGWEAAAEYSFNHYGERGSVDVLAWHRDRVPPSACRPPAPASLQSADRSPAAAHVDSHPSRG